MGRCSSGHPDKIEYANSSVQVAACLKSYKILEDQTYYLWQNMSKQPMRPIGTGDLSMMARAPLATKATSVSQGHQKTEE